VEALLVELDPKEREQHGRGQAGTTLRVVFVPLPPGRRTPPSLAWPIKAVARGRCRAA
jgi:hypothetical protein